MHRVHFIVIWIVKNLHQNVLPSSVIQELWSNTIKMHPVYDQTVVKDICVSVGDICYFYAGPIISEHCKGKLENSHTRLV